MNGNIVKLTTAGMIGKSNNSALDQIICIIDRSCSMSRIKCDAEKGINSFITEQAEINQGNAQLTLVQFDDEYEVVQDKTPIREVQPYRLFPRSMTALLDAIGKTVSSFEAPDNSKVIVVISTDGVENSSKEFNLKMVRALIEEKQALGWEFIFLGANMDAMEEADKMGMDVDNSVTYSHNSAGVANSYALTSGYVKNLRNRLMSRECAKNAFSNAKASFENVC